jgi:hypothetical protein
MPRDDTDSNERRCPECAWPCNDRGCPPPDSLLHWRITIPALAAALALAAACVWLYQTRLDSTSGFGTPRTTILDRPALTRADVERIAREGSPGNSLCAQVCWLIERQSSRFRSSPGDVLIDAGFFVPSARLERRHSETFGWPKTWYMRAEKARFDDPVTRTGFQPWKTKADAPMLGPDGFLPGADYMSPQERWSWNPGPRSIAYRPPVEETGGVKVNIDIMVNSIAGTVGLIILAWGAASAMLWLFNLGFRRKQPIRCRWIKWAAASMMSVFIAIMAAQSRSVVDEVTNFEMGKQVGTNPRMVYWTKASVSRLATRMSDLWLLLVSADGDQRLAREILQATADAPESAYLGIELTGEAMITNGRSRTFGRHFGLLGFSEHQFIRRPDAGAADLLAVPAGTSLALRNGLLLWRTSTGDPAEPVRSRSLVLDSLGLLVAGLLVVWLAVRGLCGLAQRLIVWRRRRSNRCARCGYLLAPVA